MAAFGRSDNMRACMQLLLITVVVGPLSVQAQFDLQAAERHQLANGLSLLMLEEHTFPSVSVQMLYRAGGRNEPVGQSGIAHFLEHMAFRASENFPDTEVVSQIYAAGGEWHGYTWIDQTTYYSTVPSDQLDMLLSIEADRMQRLLIEERWIEPEKGAVLAEMHGYENDPASVLHDRVVFQAFLAHPYRNNVIGWERDILALQSEDVRNFYTQHYRPANAVLVVVGDIDKVRVLQQVQELFGAYPAAAATPLPHSLEPPQTGERRIDLLGAGDQSYFEIAYPAPAAGDADFTAMLVLQEWLAGGSGVNFMQEFGSAAARPGSALYGKLDNLDTWYPPAAQRYLFSIRGTAPADQPDHVVEDILENALQRVRTGQLDEEEIQRARQRVLEELVYDLGTHEELAHQLAYYHGLNALDQWLDLPVQVAQVSAADLTELANRRFQPWQRTIGRYRAGEPPPSSSPPRLPHPVVEASSTSPATASAGALSGPADSLQSGAEAAHKQPAPETDHDQPRTGILPPAEAVLLEAGLPLLIQHNPAAAASYISLVLGGNQWQGSSYLQANSPVWGSSSLSSASLPEQVDATLAMLLNEMQQLQTVPSDADYSGDPATRLEEMLVDILDLKATSPNQPALRTVVLTGQIKPEQLELATTRLDQISPAAVRQLPPLPSLLHDRVMQWSQPLAQAQLAYIVPAPLPQSPDYLAWRALQYIIAHDYEGRLGKEAISNRGLAYYIDSQYRSDGQRAWISLATGVDPARLAELQELFRQQINALQSRPPNATEVSEARSHMAGRLLTARQSNVELAEGLTQQWLWLGRLASQKEQLAAFEKLERQQVLNAIAAFTAGAFAEIQPGKADGNVTD